MNVVISALKLHGVVYCYISTIMCRTMVIKMSQMYNVYKKKRIETLGSKFTCHRWDNFFVYYHKRLAGLACVVQGAELVLNSPTVLVLWLRRSRKCCPMAIPFHASISSRHDSCISALIGRLLWGVPDLSDRARFGWLVYILSNMSLWGTENDIPSRKCQTAVAGLCWHCTVILFWRISAEVDTCLAVDRKNSDLHSKCLFK